MSSGGPAADALQQPRAPQDCSVAKHPPATVTGTWHPAAQEPAMTPAGPKPQQQSAAKKTGTRIGPDTMPTSALIVMGHTPHPMSGSCEQKGDDCTGSKLCVALETTATTVSSRSCGITSTRELDANTKYVNVRATTISNALQRSCCWPPDAKGGASLSNRV